MERAGDIITPSCLESERFAWSSCTLIVALVVGFLVAWLIARAKRAQALAEAQTQARAEIAALKERLQLREQEIAEFRPRQAAWETKETGLETELSEMKARNRELQVRMDEEQKNAAEKIAQLHNFGRTAEQCIPGPFRKGAAGKQ